MKSSARSFRVVCQPRHLPAVESLLEAEGYRFDPEPFSPYCKMLTWEPMPLGSSLAAFFGYIYIQDRASMLPPLALAPDRGSAVLDMAASPGSKSGFLAQIVGEKGFVLANEPNRERLGTLRANILKMNLLQIGTSAYPGEKLPLTGCKWPFILLDPPCSGWGTAAKNPRVLKLWHGKKINYLLQLQRQLLKSACNLLCKNGLLLYSTCTLNPEENQQQTAFALNQLGLEAVPLEPFKGFSFDSAPFGALLVNGESSHSQGFYLSLLRQTKDIPEKINAPDALAGHELPRSLLSGPLCEPKLLPPGIPGLFGEKVRFVPSWAEKNLNNGFAWQAFPLGSLQKGGAFKPETRLRALLPDLSQKDSPRIIFEEIEPLRRLIGGEAFHTSHNSPVSLWWRDLPLGICQIKNHRLIANFH